MSSVMRKHATQSGLAVAVVLAVGLACVPGASAKTYRCPQVSAESYGDVVVSNIDPVSSLGSRSVPSSGPSLRCG